MSGTPIAAAAVSSSRIAIQARPETRVAEPDAAEHGEEQERHRRPVVELVLVALLSEDEAAEPRRVDRRDAERAVGEVEPDALLVRVPDELRDDLAEPERHDREVVAPQPERREADDDPDERGERARDDEDEPEVEVDARKVAPHRRAEMERHVLELDGRQPARDVRARGVERHVAEVEEPGVPDDDVEPERHHRDDEDQAPSS